MDKLTKYHEALKFVQEFYSIGGNGEGWEFSDVMAVVNCALNEAVREEDYLAAKMIMGEEWMVS